MGQCTHFFSPQLALQQILCFICPQFQELLSWLLQPFCSASGSLGSIVQQRWPEVNGDYHWRKQSCCGCRLGKSGCQMGNKRWGWGGEIEEKGGFLLVLAHGRQLACLCDINFFLVTVWKPLASWPSQIQTDVPRQTQPTAAPYSIIFYTQRSLSQMAFFIIYVFQLS